MMLNNVMRKNYMPYLKYFLEHYRQRYFKRERNKVTDTLDRIEESQI